MLLPILLIVGCLLETTVDAEIVELFKVTASDAAMNDGFGRSVAISGDKAVVGATSGSGEGAQAAYVFDVSTGQQLVKLTPSEATPLAFGASVGISGDVAIVGSPGGAIGGHVNSAYLFDVTTGQELFRLTPSDGESANAFGRSVAIDGNMAIVGAKHHNSSAGAAYLFDVTTGQEILKLSASDAAEGDWFGWSVAISGNIAIIGAPQKQGGAGVAYLFDVTSGVQLAKLTSGLRGVYFGCSVGINGDTAVVGVFISRSAYLFDATTGDQIFELAVSESRQISRSVDISGNIAIVGVEDDDEVCPAESACNSGAAYLFDVTTGQQLAKLTASDAMRGAYFGSSVAIHGETVVVGAPNAIGGAALPGPGAAYLFRVPEPSSFALTVLILAGLLGCSRPRREQSA